VLRGRVLDREGAPFSKGAIVVSTAPLPSRAAPVRWPGGGREKVTTVTDENGEFELHGLAPEPFHVYAKPSWTGAREVFPGLSPSDGTHRLYRIRPPELTVAVLDADGEPVDLESSDAPSVAVSESIVNGVTGRVRGGVVGPGTLGFPLRIGDTYDVALIAEGQRVQRRRVACSAVPTEIRFRLEERSEDGRIEVAIDRDPNLRAGSSLTSLSLHDPVTGARVDHSIPGETPFGKLGSLIPGTLSNVSLSAPPGEYLLRLRLLGSSSGSSSAVGNRPVTAHALPTSTLGVGDQRVDVLEGETSRVRVLLRRPANFRLTTERDDALSKATESGADATPPENVDLRALLEPLDLGIRAPNGGPWIELRLGPGMIRDIAAFSEFEHGLWLGEDGLSPDLAADDYVLGVRSPSGRRTEIPLSLAPGETRDVLLPLE